MKQNYVINEGKKTTIWCAFIESQDTCEKLGER